MFMCKMFWLMHEATKKYDHRMLYNYRDNQNELE
jgi:hypothetical protein